MAMEVRQEIKDEIETVGMHSILIDESKENVGHEQLSICFRYVNDDEESPQDSGAFSQTDANERN